MSGFLQNSAVAAGASGQGGAYNINRSIRLRGSASAYFSRTPGSAGNRTTWTWSGWVKRGALNSGALFGVDGSNYMFMYFSSDSLDCGEVAGSQQWRRITSQVFRDPSAKYHVMLTFDSTQATAGNRVKLYVNGAQVTAFSTSADPSLNYSSLVNSTAAHSIGSFAAPTRQAYLDGYLSEVNFVDGQALTPSSFGEFDSITGVWKPKRFSGAYGTNGFILKFEDNSAATAAAIGKDSSGNGNNWTPNNISLTAGATYDSMTDVPTLTSATAANFAVLNPLNSGGRPQDVTDGNLKVTFTQSTSGVTGTMGVSSGQWYWETTIAQIGTSCGIGIVNDVGAGAILSGAGYGQSSGGWTYREDGTKRTNASGTAYGASYTTGDVIGVAFDATAGSLTFYKNGTSQGTAYSGLASATYYPVFGATIAVSNIQNVNFGQRPFSYTPPTGFVALNTFNLPDSTIKAGNTAMSIALDTGANIKTTTEALFTGSQFLEWIKDRANVNNHQLLNGVRGLSAVLQSNTSAAETTYSAPSGNSVGWAWRAGSSSSSNTNGSITSTVSVNPSAGFAMVTFLGNGLTSSGQTVGHGLGVTPALVVTKKCSSGTTDFGWSSWHKDLGGNYGIWLDKTSARNGAMWSGFSNINSSVFSPPDLLYGNESGQTYLALCWAPIAGYSAFGSYSPNGSTDGPFVFLGFRAKYLLIRGAGGAAGWYIYDTARQTYNAMTADLRADLSNGEPVSSQPIDILSNGFKIRTTDTNFNSAGYGPYIYAAFAENPFKNALAR